MKKIYSILIILTLLYPCWNPVTSHSKDRKEPLGKPPIGKWNIVRIDLAEGASQIRFIPDGKAELNLAEDDKITLKGVGDAVISGKVNWARSAVFSIESDHADAGFTTIRGTWAGGQRRLILSFKWHGVPMSILLHPSHEIQLD